MTSNPYNFPPGTEVSLVHPLFDGAPSWLTDGSVGMAKAEAVRDDGGQLKVTINFVPAFVTGREAAALLRVSQRTVGRLVGRGDLKVMQFGPERRITWSSLLECAGIQEGGLADASGEPD